MQTCYLCSGSNLGRKPGRVRDNPAQPILFCRDCGLVFLGKEAARGAGFYADSGMHGAQPPDPQAWLCESAQDDGRRTAFLANKLPGRSVLDFGCGAGGFLLEAKRVAGAVRGIEPERRLSGHFAALGLMVDESLDAMDSSLRFDVVTAFHVLEHLDDPRNMLRQLAGRLSGGQAELIVEVPSATDALLQVYESPSFSEFTYWSCHQFLFDAQTLALLGRQAGLRVNFVRQVQRYPLSNHLHWLARGKPGGHQAWSFLDTPALEAAYADSLAALGLCDTLIASFSLP